jgi:hypothetical protein
MRTSWAVAGSIAYVQVAETITLEDSAYASVGLTKYSHSVESPFHVLVNITHMERSEENTRRLAYTLMPIFMDPNIGGVVIYGNDRFTKRVLKATLPLSLRVNLELVDDMAQAIDCLREQKMILPDEVVQKFLQ